MSALNTNGEYLVVYLIEPLPVGEKFSQWPLHLTVMPWFNAPSLREVEQAFQPVLSAHKPFSIEVGERAYFGGRRRPVMKLKPSQPLQALHDDLLKQIDKNRWVLEGRYTGEQYVPHITQKFGRDAKGKLLIDTVQAVEALPQGYRGVVAQMGLGQ